MTNSPRRYRVLFLGMSVSFVPAACSTQEISADPVVVPDDMPSADHGVLQIAVAPTESSFEEQQATAATNTNLFQVYFDGQQLAWSSNGAPRPVLVGEGGTTAIGYLPAGRHHFDVRAGYRGPTVFAGDGEIAAGSMTELYLFGP